MCQNPRNFPKEEICPKKVVSAFGTPKNGGFSTSGGQRSSHKAFNLFFSMSKPAPLHAASPPRPVGDRRPILRAMLNPKSVAVIGATENMQSVGRTLMENLRSFSGRPFSSQSEAEQRTWSEGIFPDRRGAGASRSSGNCNTRDRCPRRGQRMRGGRCKRCSHHFGRVQGMRRRWRTAGRSHPARVAVVCV